MRIFELVVAADTAWSINVDDDIHRHSPFLMQQYVRQTGT